MQTTLTPLLQATSGALGSAAGNTVVYPLDVATTRMQHDAKRPKSKRLPLILTLHRLVTRRRGLTRLYSGLQADTFSTLLSSFIYFYAYTSLQKCLLQYHTRAALSSAAVSSPAGIGGSGLSPKSSTPTALAAKPRPLEDLIVGILAGITAKGITLPISTVCVRQQVDEHGEDRLSLLDTLKAIQREGGVAGLFSGFPPTILLTLLPSLTLYVHSVLLRLLVPERLRAHPPGSVTFLLGALSNALATIPLYPLVLIKTLDQSGQDKGKEKEGEGGMMYTLNNILRREGVAGLYVGFEGQLVKGLVSQGVMMLVKQRVEEGIIKIYRSRF